MKVLGISQISVFAFVLLLGMVIAQNPIRVTRRNFMDNASFSPSDVFEFGDFSMEYSIAVTRLGQAYLKPLSAVSIPDPQATFRLNNLQTFWQVSCWKNSNKCVFSGEGSIELWDLSTGTPTYLNSFRYADKKSPGSNMFEAIAVIPDTEYFLAGDTKDLSVTRWKASDPNIMAELPINLPIPDQDLYECEQIVIIPSTRLAMLHYDSTDHIILMDFVSMIKIREIRNNVAIAGSPDAYKEFKCDSTTYYSDRFRILCMQQKADETIDFSMYNYSTGQHVSFLAGSPVTDGARVMFRVVNVPQTPFFLGAMKFVLVFLRMLTEISVGFIQQQVLGFDGMRSATWYPGLKNFLVTFEYQQELVGIIRGTACSIECNLVGGIPNCNDSTPFYSSGCVSCTEGPALANGNCPPPVGVQYNLPDTTNSFTGQSQIESNTSVKVISLTDSNTSPIAPLLGVAIQDQKLVPLRDQKNPTSHIIGAVLAGAAIASLYCCCLLAFCWRRKKKEEEKKHADEESAKIAHPIWMTGQDPLSDDEEGSFAKEKKDVTFSKSSQRQLADQSEDRVVFHNPDSIDQEKSKLKKQPQTWPSQKVGMTQ